MTGPMTGAARGTVQSGDKETRRTIRFTVVECSLGWIAVAATSRGICSVEFGDKPQALRDALTVRFGMADVREPDAEFLELVRRVVAHVEAPADKPDLPLDIQGTAFQRKVWEQLRSIPAGTTATYSEIARRINKPGAARAVAAACAANTLAVVIPCHRIIRKDGALSGYRWGVKRKRDLLILEAGQE